MALFEKVLEAKVMSTHLLIRADVSKKILLQAHKIATEFEKRYSAYRKDSYLNTINQHAGKQAIACTEADYALFKRAIHASEQTEGLFDITIGALSHGAYHFGFTNQSLASPQEIDKQKKLVNYKNIQLSEKRIKLTKEGMRLDLGGIGKGYVAKLIADFLEKAGANKILVDVGGEIVTRGRAYTIALRDPFSKENIATIKTSDQDTSISTSGNYERFIDQKNHHILHASKGNSSDYYSSISILQNGWNIDYLDAYATAIFNLPHERLKEIAKKRNISIIAIDCDQNIMLYNLKETQLSGIDFYH